MLNGFISGFLISCLWLGHEANPPAKDATSFTSMNAMACDLIVDAGPDTNVCAPGGLIELMGSITGNSIFYSWSPSAGLSNAFILNPTANITGPITYTLNAYGIDPNNPNLVVNGNFSAGNIGFITDYNYVADIPGLQNEMVPEGTYHVGPNPNLLHTGFSACADHTGGGGNMMIVNGAASFQDVWCQTIAITPNSLYNISAWVASVNPSSPAELQFSINGLPIGAIVNAVSTPCVWTPFNALWNSGANSSAQICILNLNTAAGGNDFAIDDISMVGLCAVEDEVTITLYDEVAPTPQINGPAFLCEGETGTYTASFPPDPPIYSYSWSVPSGASIINGQGTPTINVLWPNAQVGEICLDIETRCDMNDACFEVTVGTVPEFPLIVGPTDLCPDETAIFYTNEIDPADMFNWIVPSNLVVTGGDGTNEIEVEWALPGDAEICVEVTNVCGTTDNCTIMTLWPGYLTLFDTLLCEGSTIVINGTTYGNGLFTGTEIFTTAAGCDSIVEIEITEATSLEFMETSNLCPGDSVFLQGAYQTQEGMYTDSFTTISGCDSIVITEVIITPFDTTWIFLGSCFAADTGTTVENFSLGNCDSTVITQISLLPTDTLLIFLFSCLPADTGTTSSLHVNQFGCDSLVVTSVDLLPTDTTALFQRTCDPTQVGIFFDTLTNSSGCDSLVITTISYSASDTIWLTNVSCFIADTGTVSTLHTNSMGCDSLVILTTTYGGSGTTFLISSSCSTVDTGYLITTLTNQYGCDSIISLYTTYLLSDTTMLTGTSCEPLDTGQFIQQLINTAGCDSVVFTTITLDPISLCDIETEVTFQPPRCYGDTTLVTITASVGLAPFAVQWMHALLPIQGNTVINTSPGNTTIELFTTGTYYFVISSANGLSISDTIHIDDIPLLTVDVTATLDAYGYGISCAGDSSGMAVANIVSPGTPPYQMQWSNGAVTTTLQQIPAGFYAITVTDNQGCLASSNIMITEPPPMQYDFASMDITCFGENDGSITLSNMQGGITPWLTSLDGSVFSAQTNYTELSAGDHVIQIEDQNGCMREEQFYIDEPDEWSVSLGSDTSIVFGNEVVLNAEISGFPTGNLQADWSDGLCGNCLTRIVEPAYDITYIITATDENGCTSHDDIFIDVMIDRNIYVPNVFSPNGDQVNDFFLITAGTGLEEIESLTIFDRWGNLIFQSQHFQPGDASRTWDGTMNGQILNPDVFVYQLNVLYQDGLHKVFSGDVTILR